MAELERLAQKITRPLLARPRRAGGVSVMQAKAGRPELVPLAAPGSLPLARKGEHHMRRIMTGEIVVQPGTPNAFRPTFRAPVYETPALFIIIPVLYRLVAALIRFTVRHPLAASAAALLGLVFSDGGWQAVASLVAALVAAAVMILPVWWRGWPGSFHRRITFPVRGSWRRAWCYGRRWGTVLTIAGLAAPYRARFLLPVLVRVRSTGYTDRVQVKMVSG